MATKTELTARLMAQEKLRVEHRAVPTAFFDLATRTVVLPILKGDTPQEVYDLLIGHEVGHALETPPKGWHDAITPAAGRGFKSFLNVVEDARIERAMKSRYPGLRRQFFAGYQHLYSAGFFGPDAALQPDNLLLIDRINLYYKVGAFTQVTFSPREKKFLAEIDVLPAGEAGWTDTVRIATEIYAYCKDELDKKLDSTGDEPQYEPRKGKEVDQDDLDFEADYNMDDAEEGDEEDSEDDSSSPSQGGRTSGGKDLDDLYQEMQSVTDNAFREREGQLFDGNAAGGIYVELPVLDTDDFVVSYKNVLEAFDVAPTYGAHRDEGLALAQKNLYKEFMDKNGKYIAYLAKEFELRKNAAQQAKAKTAKTGALDVNKLFSYKFNSEIFKTVTTVPNGKNHGLIIIVDWSGSMEYNISATVEQVMVLVHFCKKVNIPFDVYTFLSYRLAPPKSGLEAHDLKMKYENRYDEGTLRLNTNFGQLAQILSSTMKRTEFSTMSNKLYLLAAGTRRGNGMREAAVDCKGMHLSGTPLNEAVLVTRYLIDEFRKQNKLDVVNTVVLTDGDGGLISYNRKYTTGVSTRIVYYIDPITKKEVLMDSYMNNCMAQLKALVELTRSATNSNVIGFYIATEMRALKKFTNRDDSLLAKYKAEMRTNRFVAISGLGFNEYYVVKGGKDFEIEVEELVVKKDATKTQLLKAFQQNQTKKGLNRILLNRFARLLS